MEFKESEALELKKSTSEVKEAVKSIAAILNKHQKGELYFGISNDGTIKGQDVREQTLRSVSKSISDNIEPRIYPKISSVTLSGKECVHVEFQGNDVPYYAYGRAYMRVGDEDRRLSAKEIENLILRKTKDKLRWDTTICQEAKLSDISPRKLKEFLKASGLKHGTVENSLNKLKLASDGKMRNAAVILFGKKPQSFFPNAKLRCAVFGTADTSSTIDMKDYEGDLFYLIERAREYVLKNIHIGMRVEGLRRVNVPEIDEEALREAIINAFCHRDYHEYDSVNIAVFKDRVEVKSPGLLYGGLTIEQIKKGNVSERRNELIAEMFHKVHFIEKWGRGITLILSKEPDADFMEVGTHFVTVFTRKVGERLGERLGEKLGENEKKILSLVAENPDIAIPKIAESLKISTTAVENNIKKLKQKGLIRRVGPAKGGHWEVVG